jgi:excisionase family DNA binding protein
MKPVESIPVDQFEPLLLAADAARLLNLHPVTVLRWTREGRIPHLRLGRKVMFRASELNSWLGRATLVAPFVPPNHKGEGA